MIIEIYHERLKTELLNIPVKYISEEDLKSYKENFENGKSIIENGLYMSDDKRYRYIKNGIIYFDHTNMPYCDNFTNCFFRYKRDEYKRWN